MQSSNILDIHYDSMKNEMTIAFMSGGKHKFKDIPYHVYQEMLTAKSKGQYFQEKIKGVYESEKIY